MEHSGNVNPFPLGPAPCVCPVNKAEDDVLADWTKLDAVVEKQRKACDR